MDGLHGNKKCRLLTLLAEKSANNEREPAGNSALRISAHASQRTGSNQAKKGLQFGC
jgi:hypothetical protein